MEAWLPRVASVKSASVKSAKSKPGETMQPTNTARSVAGSALCQTPAGTNC